MKVERVSRTKRANTATEVDTWARRGRRRRVRGVSQKVANASSTVSFGVNPKEKIEVGVLGEERLRMKRIADGQEEVGAGDGGR